MKGQVNRRRRTDSGVGRVEGDDLLDGGVWIARAGRGRRVSETSDRELAMLFRLSEGRGLEG